MAGEPRGPLSRCRPLMARGSGTVFDFDLHRGCGTVRCDDGRELFFHCTRIADGSRAIEPGARVTFDVVAGHRGRWEADGLAEHPA